MTGAAFAIDDSSGRTLSTIWPPPITSASASATRWCARSLPLYMGRVASFVMEMADADAGQVETRLEQLCTIFEQEKDYLRRRWSNER